MLYFQNSKTPMLEMTTDNEKFDKNITKFKEILKNLEESCLLLYNKLYFLQTGEQLDKELKIVSLVKNVYMKNCNKFLIPVNKEHCKCILLEYPSNKKTIIKNWEMVVPTYGIAVIRIKNFWVRDDKCGINWILECVQIMPSHLLDWQLNCCFTNPDNITEFLPSTALIEKSEFLTPIEHNPEYEVYFKMKKMGIPIQAIQNKMRLNGHNPELLDYSGKLTIQIAQQQIKLSNTLNTFTTIIPQPPPPPLSTKITENKPNILGLISQINSKEFKLKKTIIEDKTQKIYNNTNLKVPKLQDIQTTLSQLKKTDKTHLK
jgi:hypothetical protein